VEIEYRYGLPSKSLSRIVATAVSAEASSRTRRDDMSLAVSADQPDG
jgi:hypothetical protein